MRGMTRRVFSTFWSSLNFDPQWPLFNLINLPSCGDSMSLGVALLSCVRFHKRTEDGKTEVRQHASSFSCPVDYLPLQFAQQEQTKQSTSRKANLCSLHSSSFLYPPSAAAAAAAAKSLQSCLTLCNPIDGSPPGSPVPGILQAGTLEWVAISFSNA